MSSKKKGICAERELIHMFWNNSWACIRVAGSGSSQYPCPDILAGNKIRKIAIECKVTKEKRKYIQKKEIKQLKNFAEYFGAEPWIAIKFNKEIWYFLVLEDLEETNKSYFISIDLVKRKGLSFEELIGVF